MTSMSELMVNRVVRMGEDQSISGIISYKVRSRSGTRRGTPGIVLPNP
jgi:hypothetical protein